MDNSSVNVCPCARCRAKRNINNQMAWFMQKINYPLSKSSK